MPEAKITAPLKAGQPVLIHCSSMADVTLFHEILLGKVSVQLLSPAITLGQQMPTPARPPRPSSKNATPVTIRDTQERQPSGPIISLDKAVAFIEGQPHMAHSINSVIQDQRPAGIPARLDGTRKTNPAYNSAASIAQRARKLVLKRKGGAFIPAPHKGKGWMRHQE